MSGSHETFVNEHRWLWGGAIVVRISPPIVPVVGASSVRHVLLVEKRYCTAMITPVGGRRGGHPRHGTRYEECVGPRSPSFFSLSDRLPPLVTPRACRDEAANERPLLRTLRTAPAACPVFLERAILPTRLLEKHCTSSSVGDGIISLLSHLRETIEMISFFYG